MDCQSRLSRFAALQFDFGENCTRVLGLRRSQSRRVNGL